MGYDLQIADDSIVYTHAKALTLNPRIEFCCAVDSNKERRALFQNQFRVSAYSSIDEALAIHQVDLVVIATPTENHPHDIRQILALGSPKAILCEKPIAYSIEDSRSLVFECQRANLSLYVNYIRRSEPGALHVRQRIDQGSMTGPFKGVAWYTKGLLHNGSHLINLCEFWLGKATSFSIVNHGRPLGENDATLDVSINFETGNVMFMSNQHQYNHHSIELFAMNGHLRYDNGGHIITWEAGTANSLTADLARFKELSEPIKSHLFCYQLLVLENIVRSMSNLTSNICNGVQALETHEFIDKILKVRNEHQ